VAKAGGERSDPLIRYVVDDEFGDIAHKEKSFADRVMFWRKDQPATAASVGAQPTPVDAAAEQRRLANHRGASPSSFSVSAPAASSSRAVTLRTWSKGSPRPKSCP
jgi:hypothetical protein